MKKIISIFLVLALCFSFPMSAMAGSIGNLNFATTMSSASNRGAVVKNDGSLWMWGGFTTPSYDTKYGGVFMGLQKSPVKIMDGVLSVSCSDYQTAAIKKDHSLWMWGFDTDGELGMGKSGFEVFSPTKVMDDVAAVSLGGTHTAVIKTDGSLWMFGSNQDGQIGNNRAGNGTKEDNFYGPYSIQTTPVKIMDDVVSVSCGFDFTVAIKSDKSLWYWGDKQYTPVKIMDNAASVSCGTSHYAVIKTDGSLWTCGWNMCGCLGFGTDEIYRLDAPEKLMDGVSFVCCGDDATAVIKTDGSLWMWGSNDYCIVDADSSRDIGTPMKKLDGCKAVGVGDCLAVVLKNDGTLYSWGKVDYVGNGGKGDGGSSRNSEGDVQLKPVKILDNVAFPDGISSVTVPDIPSTWAKAEVEAAVSSGIVPENLQKNYVKPVSRGKVAELFINLVEETYDTPIDEILKEKGVEINEDVFSDTSDKNVLYANALGIINGTGNNKFSPNGTLTRAQVAAIINRTAKVLGIDTEGYSHNFTDVSSHWVDSELGWPVEMGIINGTGNNKFSPDAELTTEQTILIVYRALNALE